MEFRYRVFLAVANHMSFSKAARELNISQPAVTSHIRELENTLGTLLFDRSKNSIKLTKAGELVYEYAHRALQDQTDFLLKLNFFKFDSASDLTIGASPTIYTYFLPRYIGKFNVQFPDMEVNLIPGSSRDIEQKTIDGELDLGIIEQTNNHQSLMYLPIKKDEITAVTGPNHPLSSHKQIPLHQLQNMVYVEEKPKTAAVETLEIELKEQGEQIPYFQNTIHLGNTEAIKQYISQSNSFAFLSTIAIENEIKLLTLQPLDIKNLPLQRNLYAVLPKNLSTKKAQYFIQFLEHAIQNE